MRSDWLTPNPLHITDLLATIKMKKYLLTPFKLFALPLLIWGTLWILKTDDKIASLIGYFMIVVALSTLALDMLLTYVFRNSIKRNIVYQSLLVLIFGIIGIYNITEKKVIVLNSSNIEEFIIVYDIEDADELKWKPINESLIEIPTNNIFYTKSSLTDYQKYKIKDINENKLEYGVFPRNLEIKGKAIEYELYITDTNTMWNFQADKIVNNSKLVKQLKVELESY